MASVIAGVVSIDYKVTGAVTVNVVASWTSVIMGRVLLMVYTVTQLVSEAFYTSGIVGKEFEQVSGEQQTEGLQYLNSLLAKKTADKSGIPYYLRYSANFVIGQEQYTIPG